jgi:hypothetical protein
LKRAKQGRFAYFALKLALKGICPYQGYAPHEPIPSFLHKSQDCRSL